MTTLVHARPRVRVVPEFTESKADDVFAMAELVEFELDGWQREVIEGSCGIREGGKWAAFEVGVNVPRQNGKGGILELVELTSLFTWGERFVIHSAHEFITSQLHFQRVWSLVENTPSLLGRVYKRRPLRTHGQEGFQLTDGCAIQFRSRTKAGGRGFSCDKLFLDEAMFLPDAALGALFPTMRARKNPQIWLTGSAVDQEVHNEGYVFTRLRDRALKGDDPSLAYFEWSLPYDHPDEVPEEAYHAEDSWRESNPAYGIRIFGEHFEKEIRTLPRRTSAVELFGVGDYPDPDGAAERPITPEQWGECEDADSRIISNLCLAYDVSPERRTSIAAAGRNQDGRWHVEVIEKLPGTGWLPARMVDLVAEHEPELVVCDGLGPAASLVVKLEEFGVNVKSMTGAEHAQGCGLMVDAVREDNLRHLGSADLWNAIRAAGTRPLSDRWLWSRRKSTADISPLVAATLALWAAFGQPDDDGEMVIY